MFSWETYELSETATEDRWIGASGTRLYQLVMNNQLKFINLYFISKQLIHVT